MATMTRAAGAGGNVSGGEDVYAALGLTPVINARGNQTVLGGALLSARIQAAMDAANRYFVDMESLLKQTGKKCAELLECEAAYVTPGCAAALALGTAACITGDDGELMERLPDTTGMENVVVIQSRHRYKYDRPPTIVGAKLREAGDAQGTTTAQLKEAVGTDTAAVLFPAHVDGREGTVPLVETIEIAHAQGVPVLLDAASQIYPVTRMRNWTKMGADLVCFGAKYFGAPHSTGLLTGRRDLVESAVQQGFIGFERGKYRTFGRPLKLDRGEIVAVALALEEWMTMDHEARIARVRERVEAAIGRVAGLPRVSATTEGSYFGAPGLRIRIDPAGGRTAEEVARALEKGSPSIVASQSGDAIAFNLTTVYEGDELVIAERLREALAA